MENPERVFTLYCYCGCCYFILEYYLPVFQLQILSISMVKILLYCLGDFKI
jgi:hypothetical protein